MCATVRTPKQADSPQFHSLARVINTIGTYSRSSYNSDCLPNLRLAARKRVRHIFGNCTAFFNVAASRLNISNNV